jgi:CHASE2 domain-containing sensor protein
MGHIFISYSRKDKLFVQSLHAALQAQRRDTWIDWLDILPTEKWWNAIEAGIEGADTFAFIISPDSVKSEVCAKEIEHALKHHKRLVPIVYREIEDHLAHPALSTHNWLFMREEDDFDQALEQLFRAIDTDLAYVRNHTRLLIRAIEWEREKRDDSFLLRGKDLAASEKWLHQGINKTPAPTDLQVEYIKASRAFPQRRLKLRTVISSSVTVAIVVLVIRILGLLQPLELTMYDHFLRSRPSEPLDPRFLIVEVDEQDIRRFLDDYDSSKGTIPDAALNQALQVLQQYQPRLIGLDIYRDFEAEPMLAQRFSNLQNVVFTCRLDSDPGSPEQDGVQPPPEVNQDANRIGFTDFVDERGVVRRHFLDHAQDETCPVRQSFSLVLARRYLESEGYAYQSPLDEFGNYGNTLQIGDTAFRAAIGFLGGYQTVDLGGYQILLNYRSHQSGNEKSAANFAKRVSFRQVLDNQIAPADVADKIIMIGIASKSTRESDNWDTPFGEANGVVIQAQMISQIISAVQDDRPLLWWWSIGVEILWIIAWSLLGGIIVWGMRRTHRIIITSVIAFVGLCGLCYFTFCYWAGWIPLVPAALVFVITVSGTGWLTYRLRNV